MTNKIAFFFSSNFSKDKHFYRTLNSMFGLYPNNIDLYKLALVHKSASILLTDGTHINNERLEYLGDAVIEAVVSDMLYIDFPYENEGFMTQLRSRIVSRSSLNELATRLGLDNLVVAQNSFSNSRKHMYGDAFEAMMGAIYLDKGYNYVNRLLINKIIKCHIDIDTLMETESDYKSRLIEWCQKHKKKITIVSKHSDSFSDDNTQFCAVVSIGDIEQGYGLGNSKKEAEQRACKHAAETLKIDVLQK